ncbi:hypothetical protein Q9295_05275 [Xinfangfangia sp. CPCC 101601]|uniref:Uncharacterized protein n=1 Tax=Pseudogemmobacter lacusdianii TaxID=3069608 RepID=A0ABU0VW84_9RHOB|nr:hypothetical protein [Xinfangfangia sp. CPCC 101601]MDQ2065773.1 hypothetical protein [Xinfangfangia sp. CPCC 101601]
MRDFFINWSEKLIGVFVGLMVLAVVIAGFGMMFAPQGGFFQGLLVLVGGLIYAVIMGGMLYLFFGIYRNTQQTNVLLEQILRK